MAVYLAPDAKKNLNGVTVNEYFLTLHNPNKISLPAKRSGNCIGVTIHNTGRIITAAQTTPAEQYTRATYNGNMDAVRVHFYVDDVGAWQNLPLDWQSWHAGHKGRKDANGSERGNALTISIECIMNGSGDKKDRKARDNAARLAAYLLDTYGGELYTHNYWENIRNGKKGTVDELNKLNDGYKNCPVYIRPKWDEFKALVQSYRKGNSEESADNDEMYYLQIGAFKDKNVAEAALKTAQTTKKAYPDAFLKKFTRKI